MAGPLASAPAALAAALLVVSLLTAGSARAGETSESAGPAPTDLHASAGAASEPPPPGAVLPLDDLELATAGASGDTNVFTDQQVTAANSGNSITADSVVSGDITFADNALSGFNGVGNFIFNTGANNNLQGVVSVNVVSVPAP
jgi:hypothetical protein